MMKRRIIILTSLLALAIVGILLWWYRPWVSYLKEEPMYHPNGVLREESGMSYGWGDNVDVYTPEYLEGVLDYPNGKADWSSGRIWVDGHYYGELCTIKEFENNGFKSSIEDEDEDGTEVRLTKDAIELLATTNKFGHIYQIETSTPSVSFVKGLDSNTSRWLVKRILGQPSDYARYSKDSIEYMYYEDLVMFELVYDIDFKNKISNVCYSWYRVKQETDYDNDGVPDPLPNPEPGLNFDYIEDHSNWVIPGKTDTNSTGDEN